MVAERALAARELALGRSVALPANARGRQDHHGLERHGRIRSRGDRLTHVPATGRLVLLVSIFRGLAVAAVALSSLHAAWGALARGPSQPLDWRAARVAKGTGIEMLYPAGWNATSNDGRDVIVASFPISKRWFASERKSLPARGIYIWAFSYGRLPHLGGPPGRCRGCTFTNCPL